MYLTPFTLITLHHVPVVNDVPIVRPVIPDAVDMHGVHAVLTVSHVLIRTYVHGYCNATAPGDLYDATL